MLLRNCTFSWTNSQSDNTTPHLRDISLEVRQGQLFGIVGRVGAGKSSMLAAILGEMAQQPVEGSEAIVRTKSIGYVPQQAWIQNRTLRANVLFDSPMDEEHYGQVLEACALEDDLKLLVAGDLTEIGEKVAAYRIFYFLLRTGHKPFGWPKGTRCIGPCRLQKCRFVRVG